MREPFINGENEKRADQALFAIQPYIMLIFDKVNIRSYTMPSIKKERTN
jgi:hypothetical protein